MPGRTYTNIIGRRCIYIHNFQTNERLDDSQIIKFMIALLVYTTLTVPNIYTGLFISPSSTLETSSVLFWALHIMSVKSNKLHHHYEYTCFFLFSGFRNHKRLNHNFVHTRFLYNYYNLSASISLPFMDIEMSYNLLGSLFVVYL